MTDRQIKREAGLTWRLEDRGPFEKLRLRVQVPTMWLWPTVMQISPLRRGSPGRCPSVSVWVTAWLSYIAFPCGLLMPEDQHGCVCFWGCWLKSTAEMRPVTMIASVSYYICKCECFHSSYMCSFRFVSSLESNRRLQSQPPLGKYWDDIYLPLCHGRFWPRSVPSYRWSGAPIVSQLLCTSTQSLPLNVKTDNLLRLNLGEGFKS